MSRRSGIALAALLLALAIPAGAQADTLVSPIAEPGGPMSVASYGSTFAIVMRLAPTNYVLMTQELGGPLRVAPIAPFPREPRISVGPEHSGARVVVYSRCATNTTTSCDVHKYAPATRTERKLGAISRPGVSSETAASYFKGNIAFTRTGSGTAGVYLYRPGRALRLLDRKPAFATGISTSRVSTLYWPKAPSGGSTFVRLMTYAGGARTVRSADVSDAGGTRLSDLVMTRYHVYWRASDPISETARAERVGFHHREGPGAVQRSARALPGTGLAVSVRKSGLLYYLAPSGAANGLFATAPLIRFGA